MITVTCGDRPQLLGRLVESLRQQSCSDFEHIVIDHREHPELAKSLSRARNLGLAHARGDFVAFPDDDAWYGPDTLTRVAKALEGDELDGISFRVTDEQGVCSAGGYMSGGQMLVTRSNIWRTIVSCSFFVKRASIGHLEFDPTLGVGSGTRFGSGEETDFVLKLIGAGGRLRYDGAFSVYHQVPLLATRASVGWVYGNGCGLVLRRHGYGVLRLAWMATLQLVRAVQACAHLRLKKAVVHSAMAAGRICGYYAAKRPE